MRINKKKALMVICCSSLLLLCVIFFIYFLNTKINENQEFEFSQAKPISLEFDKDKLELVTNGVLTVAISPPYAPYEYTEDGVLKGFDVECAKVFADDLNLRVKFVQMPFSSLLKNVENGSICDIAMGGIQVKEERKNAMNFSTPYYVDTSLLLSRVADSTTSENVAQKIESEKLKLCAVESSTAADYIVKNYPNNELITGQDFKDCANKLILGEADLLLTSNNEYHNADSFSKLRVKVVDNFYDNRQEVAVALPKNREYLLGQINKIIEARWNDEYIDELLNKYFSS